MITIRQIKEADLPQTLVIYNDIILHTTAVYSYSPQTMKMREDWYAAKLKDGYPVFVAESEGKVVGFSSFGAFRAWDAYKYTIENSIYVLADQRGKGIGKRLLEPLIAAAREKDFHAIIASIDASNSVSLQLHRSFGFEEVAHFKQVGFKFGRWLDLKFLELLLDTPEHPREKA
jgi:L-amino acid N-acyltransferase